MLIKHESFDVSQRRKSDRRLYEPGQGKYPYLKFILIPAVIGFMLLCILMNVDFSQNPGKLHGPNQITVEIEMKNKKLTASIEKSPKFLGFHNEQVKRTEQITSNNFNELAANFPEIKVNSLVIGSRLPEGNKNQRRQRIIKIQRKNIDALPTKNLKTKCRS
ncbi:uncharacterized protein LOC131806558 [Musca domestica]|uniref:Uncharacterized protein LOC131806558 n=1 Tax=Musca domestica TaxID=7370 RepID=A0ABM3VLT5_MUSDO|nr:uncharacterized protein LOC131806558 [Musca domestica]